MRILLLADPLDNQNAGIHIFTKEMISALIRTNPGHKIILIRERKDDNLEGVTQIAVPNTRLPIGFASLRLFLIVPLIALLKKSDVVIEPAHFGPFNLPKKIKRITLIHDLTPILFPHLHRWHSQILQKIFLKRILNKADKIVANSENTKNDICKVYPENCNKVVRIYPGRGKEFIPSDELPINGPPRIQDPYFLFVGTIEPRKNLLLLLEAYRLFRQKSGKKIKLIIAGGKGWKYESFFEALENHPFKNEIRIAGFIDKKDLPDLYRNSLALLYPSLYEGFGLPILEAIACGIPVIAADNSSLREAGGNIAFYFQADDPAALERRMTELADDISRAGKSMTLAKEHLQKFDWDQYAETFWKEIESLR